MNHHQEIVVWVVFFMYEGGRSQKEKEVSLRLAASGPVLPMIKRIQIAVPACRVLSARAGHSGMWGSD